MRLHPATPEGKLFRRFRVGALDCAGRSSRQRSSYVANESRGVCDAATRANGFDVEEAKGETDAVDVLELQSMVVDWMADGSVTGKSAGR